MRTVLTWLWPGGPYHADHVNALERMVRAFTFDVRFLCIQEGFSRESFSSSIDVMDTPAACGPVAGMANMAGNVFPRCFRRLWTFSREAADIIGGEVLQVDIDAIVCKSLSRYFMPDHDFVGWRPRQKWGRSDRIGGGIWYHKLGTRNEVWDKFIRSPRKEAIAAHNRGYRGSDQSVMSNLLEGSKLFDEPNGIYNSGDHRSRFQPHSEWVVPEDATVIMFNGRVKPWQSNAEWAQRLYRPYLENSSGGD